MQIPLSGTGTCQLCKSEARASGMSDFHSAHAARRSPVQHLKGGGLPCCCLPAEPAATYAVRV